MAQPQGVVDGDHAAGPQEAQAVLVVVLVVRLRQVNKDAVT